MKVKNLFITFGLSLALGVVAAVGAGQKAPQKAEATGEVTFYFVDYGNLLNGDASCYFYSEDGETKELGSWPGKAAESHTTDSNGKSIYSVTLSQPVSSFSKLEITNTAKTRGSWNVANYDGTDGKGGDSDFDCFVSTAMESDYNFTGRIAVYSKLNGYFLHGTYDSWGKGVAMESDGTNATITLDFLANAETKVVKHAYYDMTWYNPYGKTTSSDGTVTVTGDGGNAKIANAGNYTLTFNIANSTYHFDKNEAIVYSLSDGTQTISLEAVTGGYSGSATLVAGRTMSFLRNGVSTAYTVNPYEGNNLDSDKHIKVSTSANVSIFMSDASELWIDGYEELYDYALDFLSSTISDGVCSPSSSTWSGLESNFNGLDGYQREEFASNVTAVSTGSRTVFSSKVYEAAVRYVVIIEKGTLSPFENAPVSQLVINSNNLPTQSNTNVLLIIVAIMITTVSGVVIAFSYKRRKER